MTEPTFQVKLWGTRGSLPVSGPMYREFGGNTICIELRLGEHVVFIDAGSGLLPAGAALKADGHGDVALFLTHCHYDHVIGLPFFMPLYGKGPTVTLSSGHLAGKMTTQEIMRGLMQQPFFPIGPELCSACLKTRDFVPGDVLTPFPGVSLRTAALNHPGGAVGYRVEWAGRAVAVITDVEHVPGTLDPAVLELIRGVDLFLYDACYTDEEFERFRGFGHSTWQQGLRLAQAAGARQVGLIHHATWRSDADLTGMEGLAQQVFAGAFFGRDLQVIDL
ncbi:MAG: MBL fold metallo-hydrolase [Rhizobiales bacterium 17-65-6]|nr:MAG: MBL fold metallo-hydrolase [Rhizobiales bacterium 17-65-6]